jgi:glutamate/tyrosine decarboxylase-like PLP-dependent enzyme
MPLPARGLSTEAILRTLEAYKQHDVPWRDGAVFAGVYDPGPEAQAQITAAYTMFLSENALYPNFFPSLLQIENDIVRILAELLQSDGEVVGNCTSGGTESIMLAVKAARDKARAERPGLGEPELVLPHTAHAAFHKAAHYLGVRTVVTPFDPQTFRADPEAIRRAITPNTILLVASAPCYSHGVVDPIGPIGQIALEHGLPLHVDACVGGVQLAVMRGLGEPVPPFDFSVPGVTSISVDMHKYGYAAKNASAILYRGRALRRYALFSSAGTTGYAVINPTVLSSKSGGPLAGAWATLHALGQEGYQRIVREVMGATRRLLDGIQSIDGLRVLGQPDMCMFAFASERADVFELDDELVRRGWWLQPQFSAGGGPANLHLTVNRSNVARVEALLEDLRAGVAAVRARGADGAGEVAALRGEVQRLMASPGPDTFAQIAGLAGLQPGAMPTSFARINAVLDALPDPVVDALLIEYLNSLYA